MTRIRFGIYLGEDGPKIGRGKIHLLKAIREHGSISAAARSMGMSYRHAWRLLDELNRIFDEPVIRSKPGGARGGGAVLTAWGDRLIDRFEEMDRLARDSLAPHLAELEARLVADEGGDPPAPPPVRRGPKRRRRATRAG